MGFSLQIHNMQERSPKVTPVWKGQEGKSPKKRQFLKHSLFNKYEQVKTKQKFKFILGQMYICKLF